MLEQTQPCYQNGSICKIFANGIFQRSQHVLVGIGINFLTQFFRFPLQVELDPERERRSSGYKNAYDEDDDHHGPGVRVQQCATS